MLCFAHRGSINHIFFTGEKLFSSFTWHMSGIHTNSTTLIGRHISTLVRTLTAIGSDLEEPQHQNELVKYIYSHILIYHMIMVVF